MSNKPHRQPGDRAHNRHDLDLVAAYAGDDHGIDRDAAAALVSACSECRSEYDLQRNVMNWIAQAPLVSLTDEERGLLHERVNRSVGGAPVVSISDRRRKRQPGQLLFRIGAAAAALAVFAGLGGLFNNMAGDADQSAIQTIASDLASGSEESAASPATTTTAMAMFGATSSERTMMAGGDAEAVSKEVEELVGRAEAQAEGQAPENAQADAMTAEPPCLDKVEDREILLSAESMLDGEPIVMFVVAGEEGPEALLFQSSDCSIVDLG